MPRIQLPSGATKLISNNRKHTLKQFTQLRKQSSAAAAESSDEEKLWVRSPLPHVDTVVGFTIPEVIRENLGAWGNLTAFECAETGVKYTHDEVLQHSRGFAAALIKSGFKPGQVIGIVLPNCPEFASVLYGIWEAGLIASPVNPSYTLEELQRQLEACGAVCAVTTADYLDSVKKVKAASSIIKSIVIVGEASEGCHTYKEMVKQDQFGVRFFKGKDCDTLDTVALLPFSSGTTGPPKGVCLTHSNITTNVAQTDPALGLTLIRKYNKEDGQERHVGLLPFFHSYGMNSLLHSAMWTGGHVMCLKKFTEKTFLDTIRLHKPTALHLVTPLITHIANSPNYGPAELEYCRTVIGAAAPIGPSLIHKLLDKAGKYFFFQEGYGMTELSPTSHALLPSTKNTKIGSCGTPVSSTLMKIIDPVTGATIGKHEKGEICVKGPQVMKGYYNNEEATRNTIDEQGWLHTGDIGYYDESGCCFIVDRIKELIKVNGMQVAPSELEDLLREHSDVEDVAVIGVPDERAGEAPRAYIVRKSKSKVSEEDINEFLKPRIAYYKQLKGGIEWRDSIPKAPSGKILRRELSDEFRKKYNIDG